MLVFGLSVPAVAPLAARVGKGGVGGNLRYRAVLLDHGKRRNIAWTSSGTIVLTDQNVAAIVEPLRRSKLLDFGVPAIGR